MTYRRIRIARIGRSEPVVFAVRELVKYLKQMDPKLMVDLLYTDAYNPDSEGVLWVGRGLPAELPTVRNAALDDGISVEVTNGVGYITGTNDRSVLLAVYRFLQELGCVWLGPGVEGERIPARPVENVNVSLREAASFRHRGICIEGTASFENIAELIDFLPKAGMNVYFFQQRVPRSYLTYWYGHLFNDLMKPEPLTANDVDLMNNVIEEEMALRGLDNQRWGHGWTCLPYGLDPMSGDQVNPVFVLEELPEDFRNDLAMIDGERKLFGGAPVYSSLCYSRKSVRDRINDYVVDYCKTHPHVTTVHFWLADMANNQCECEDCVKKTASDWYIVMLNELDEKLTQAGLNTKIVFLLYNDLLWAPEEEVINNQDRFTLMFAPVSRVYGETYGDYLVFDGELPPYQRNKLVMPTSIAENIAHLRNWQSFFHGDSFMFEYYLMWAHTGDMGYERVAKNIYQDVRCLPELGIDGMVNVQLQRAGFPTNLPLYIMGKALWNKDCDYEQEVAHFYKAAFGHEAGRVHEYLKELSQLSLMYNEPSTGDDNRPYGPFFRDYKRLRELLAQFRPVIDTHVAQPDGCYESWKLLQYHSDYVSMLADALELAEQKKSVEARAIFDQIHQFVCENEVALRKVYDSFLAFYTLRGKAHLSKITIEKTDIS